MKLETNIDIIKYYHDQIISDNPLAFIDNNYNIFTINNAGLEVINRTRAQVLNKSILEISRKEWRDNLKIILDTCITDKKEKQVLSLRFDRQKPYWLLLFTYAPIISTDKGDVIGIKITAATPHFKLNPYNLKEILSSTLSSHKAPLAEIEAPKTAALSELERTILYLLHHNFSYEEIATTLTIVNPNKQYTKQSVAKIVARKLYDKFDVTNLLALRTKYRRTKLHSSIPRMLFDEFSYLVV